jgi:hypothetical protein
MRCALSPVGRPLRCGPKITTPLVEDCQDRKSVARVPPQLTLGRVQQETSADVVSEREDANLSIGPGQPVLPMPMPPGCLAARCFLQRCTMATCCGHGGMVQDLPIALRILDCGPHDILISHYTSAGTRRLLPLRVGERDCSRPPLY